MYRLTPRIAAAVFGLTLVALPVEAAYVVFGDGRYLQVERYRFERGRTVVELASGGVLSFASSRVRYVVPDPDVEEQPRPPGRSVAGGGVVGSGVEHWLTFADPRFVDPIRRVSSSFDLDPALVAAVVKIESDFRPHAVSPKGAQGLMQLMPPTARELEVVDPFDPEQNLMGGAAYLSDLIHRYGGDLERALAAYNAGPGVVDRVGGIPPYRETQRYVRNVLGLMRVPGSVVGSSTLTAID